MPITKKPKDYYPGWSADWKVDPAWTAPEKASFTESASAQMNEVMRELMRRMPQLTGAGNWDELVAKEFVEDERKRKLLQMQEDRKRSSTTTIYDKTNIEEATKETRKKEKIMNIGEEIVQQITKEVQARFEIPKDELKKFISTELEDRKPKTIVIKQKDLPNVKFDSVHSLFDRLLHLMACRLPIFITGPAGSGKTRAVEQAAEALSIEFSSVSVGPQTTQSHLMGYMDAVGKYVQTEFRKRYEKGGVFLIDEFDAGSPQVLTCLNSALSGSFCAFPDGMIKKHENFMCIATGNTYGNGANRIYVGRNQLDGATLDRFVFLEWNYCPKLEKTLAQDCDQWYQRVKQVRDKATQLGIRAIVSPRATIYGATLIKSGLRQPEVEEMVLWKGISEADRKRLA